MSFAQSKKITPPFGGTYFFTGADYRKFSHSRPPTADYEVEKFFNPLPLRGIGEKPNLRFSSMSFAQSKKITPPFGGTYFFTGADYRTRTGDLLFTRQLLYQLS